MINHTHSIPSIEAIATKGWFGVSQWLILRRLSQLLVLGLFLSGPLFGFWIAEGTLASSLTLEVLPLTDPLVLLQELFAGYAPETIAIIGAMIIVGFYLLVGGRTYCSWACPVNIITDTAAWLRKRFHIKAGVHFSRHTRHILLAAILLVAAFSGTIAWELINPVSVIFRGLIFGMGMAWGMVVAIFLLDLIISRRAWCGHLCPVGAFYGLLGHFSLIRVSADNREQCDDCMDCFSICPEQMVISPALKGADKGIGPVILSGHCTNCGRCIDVCARDVFHFSTRFNNNTHSQRINDNKEVLT